MLPKGSYAIDVLFWWGLALLLTIILLGEDSEGAELKSHIKEFAIETACKEGVDPKIVLAIIKVESAGKTHVIGRAGEIGLMQLKPQFHPEGAQFNYIKNITAGVNYLKRIKNLHRDKKHYYVYYNIGPYNKKVDKLENTKYYRLINKEITREKINYNCAGIN